MRADIVTITLNPAVDKNYSVDGLVPEHKLRCDNPIVDAGGGGINVSKGLKRLEEDSLAIFFAGGTSGKHLEELVKREQLRFLAIPIENETRESVVITDKKSGKEYRIVVKGPDITPASFQQILQQLKLISPAYIIASGSLPNGLAEDSFAILAKEAKKMNSRFILDTSGNPLQHALDEGMFLIKPNLKELSTLAGADMLQLDEVDKAAMDIIQKGKCEVVIVSLGASGAMLITKEECQHIPAPTVERKSTVGAGDSMIAGVVWALSHGYSMIDAACMGVACGTAATMNRGTKLFNKQDAERLWKWIKSKKQI